MGDRDGRSFERRPLGHRAYAVVSTTLERAGFLAAFTERTGGTSVAPYESLNLSFAVEDAEGAVRDNRDRVIEGLDVPAFATAEQPHGTKAVRIGAKRAGAGFDGIDGRIGGADVLFTGSAGVSLAVLVADCLPVVLASPAEGTIAVVHAGWRGMAAGVLLGAAAVFADPAGVRAVIGPAIGPCHYEVQADVALAVAAGSDAGAVTERRGRSLYLDLPATARAVLRSLGVRKLDVSGLCTACERRRFFSHRRDGTPAGRQAAVAMRR